MLTLQDRCRNIWKNEFNIGETKIDWLIGQLTQNAINNSELVSDEQIRAAKCRLLWYGLNSAIYNYLKWEDKNV